MGKKKQIMIILIWLVGTVMVFSATSIFTCWILTRELVPSELGYLKLGEKYANIEECNREPAEGSHVSELVHTLEMRAAMSDYIIEGNGVKCEHAILYTSQNGDFELSRGGWICVRKGDTEHNGEWMRDEFAIVNIQDCIQNGYAEKLLEFIKQHEEGMIRIDEYAMKGVRCYPIHISLIDQGECIEEIVIELKQDVQGYELCKANDVWLADNVMGENLEYALKITGEASQYANQLKESLIYKDESYEQHNMIVTPFKTIKREWITENGYGMICVTIIRPGVASFMFCGVTCGIWTVLMLIVEVIVWLISKRNHSASF